MSKKDSAFHYLNIALKNHKTLWPLSDNDLYPLTDDKRWPKYSKVGKIAADAPLLVINHHSDDRVRIKYIDIIKENCLNNEGS